MSQGNQGRSTSDRATLHSRLSRLFAGLADDELSGRLAEGTPLGSGIGGVRSLIQLEGVPVFVKQIPLTQTEQLDGNLRSTRDMFGLPRGCQYGIGSPSFGVWRDRGCR